MKPLNNGAARTFSATPVPALQWRHPQPSRLLVRLPLVQHPLKLLIDPVKIFVCVLTRIFTLIIGYFVAYS